MRVVASPGPGEPLDVALRLFAAGHSVVVIAGSPGERYLPTGGFFLDLRTRGSSGVDEAVGDAPFVVVRDNPRWPIGRLARLVQGLAARVPVVVIGSTRLMGDLEKLHSEVAFVVDKPRGRGRGRGESTASGLPVPDQQGGRRPRAAPTAEPARPIPMTVAGPEKEEEKTRPIQVARSVNVCVTRPGGAFGSLAEEPLAPATDYEVLLGIGALGVANLLSAADARWPENLLADEDLRLRAVLFMAGGTAPQVASLTLPRRAESYACDCPAECGCAREPWVRFAITTPDRPGEWTGELVIYVGVVAVHVQRLELPVAVSGAGPSARLLYRLTTDFSRLGPLADRAASILVTDGGARAVVNGLPFADNPVRIDAAAADGAVREMRQLLYDLHLVAGVSTADPLHRKDFVAYVADLATLARHGAVVFDRLFRDNEVFDTLPELIRHEAAARGRPSVITVADATDGTRHPVPWSLVYDLPMPADPRTDYDLCPSVARFGPGGAGEPVPAHCPEPVHQGNVLCPFGFWGLAGIVEQPVSTAAIVWHVTGDPLPHTLTAAVDPNLDRLLTKQHIVDLTAALEPGAVDTHLVRSARQLAELMAEQTTDIHYLYCHGGYREFLATRPQPVLCFGDSVLDPLDVANWRRDQGLWPRPHWPSRKPLVVMNGCHTAEMTTATLANFVDAFTNRAGAAGVVGTEISIEQGMAGAAMSRFCQLLVSGASVGAALRTLRWEMLGRGNVMGLAYTLYCVAALRLRPSVPAQH